MDFLQQLQERYINEFNNNIPFGEFVLNLVVAAILVALIRLFYIHYGNAISDRRRFANNFLPLALATLLVIMIVKSSIALSLGLVGALSIVRFRAAIKDPEELVYLFLSIGIGLACGANQPVLAAVALGMILFIIFLSKVLGKREKTSRYGRFFINISTDLQELPPLIAVLEQHLTDIELKRMDTLENGLDLSFTARLATSDQLENLQQALRQLSAATRLSVLQQPELIV